MLGNVLILAILATIVTAVTVAPNRPTIIPAVCLEEKVTGRCKARILSWFYNTKTGQCELFVYGGCDGNGNRFPSKEVCEKTCQLTDPCKQPKLVGPCLALIPRYYYSQINRRCVLFNYGGCGGNGNNFFSLQQCEKQCKVNYQ